MTTGEFAVSARAADLLDVVLNRARNVVMNNRLNVSLVDYHTVGDSAAENTHFVVCELFLDVGSLLVALPCVVGL